MRRISKTLNLLWKFEKLSKLNFYSTIRKIPKYYFSNSQNNDINPNDNKNINFEDKRVYPKTWYEEFLGPVNKNANNSQFDLEALKKEIDDLLFLILDNKRSDFFYRIQFYITMVNPLGKNSRRLNSTFICFENEILYFYLVKSYINYLKKMEEIIPELGFNPEYLKIKKQFIENLINYDLKVQNIKFIFYFNSIENTILNNGDLINSEHNRIEINKSLSIDKKIFDINEIPNMLIDIQYLEVCKIDKTFFENEKNNNNEIFFNEELEFVYQINTKNKADLDQEDRDFSELISLYILELLNDAFIEANIIINIFQKTSIDKIPNIQYEYSQNVLNNFSVQMNIVFNNIKHHLKEHKKMSPNKIDSILQNILTEEINSIIFKKIKDANFLLKILETNLPQDQKTNNEIPKRFLNKINYFEIEKFLFFADYFHFSLILNYKWMTQAKKSDQKKPSKKIPTYEKLNQEKQIYEKPESEKSDQQKQINEISESEKSDQQKQNDDKKIPKLFLRFLILYFIFDTLNKSIKFFFRMIKKILGKNNEDNADSSNNTIKNKKKKKKSERDYFLEEVMTYTTFVDLLKRKKIKKITIERVDEYQFNFKPKLTPIKVYVKDSNKQKKLFVLDVNSFLEYLEVYQSHSLKTSYEEMVPVEFSRPYSCRVSNF